MSLSEAALATVPAHNMRLARDEVAWLEVYDAIANLFYDPSELMSYDSRGLDAPGRPRVPLIDVKVCTADRTVLHSDLYMAGFERRFGDFYEIRTWRGVCFDNRFQGASILPGLRSFGSPLAVPRFLAIESPINVKSLPMPLGHITVPANSGERAVRISLANGGGCGTPANIILNKLAVWPEPAG